jgi:hypothetical protein
LDESPRTLAAVVVMEWIFSCSVFNADEGRVLLYCSGWIHA